MKAMLLGKLKSFKLNNRNLILIVTILILAFLSWVFISIKSDCSFRPTEDGALRCRREERASRLKKLEWKYKFYSLFVSDEKNPYFRYSPEYEPETNLIEKYLPD